MKNFMPLIASFVGFFVGFFVTYNVMTNTVQSPTMTPATATTVPTATTTPATATTVPTATEVTTTPVPTRNGCPATNGTESLPVWGLNNFSGDGNEVIYRLRPGDEVYIISFQKEENGLWAFIDIWDENGNLLLGGNAPAWAFTPNNLRCVPPTLD